MTKKLLSLLLAALLIIGLMAGCTTTEEVWMSYSDDEGSSVANSNDDEDADTEETEEKDDNSDATKATGKTSRTKKTTTKKGATAATSAKTRATKNQADALTFTPVADAGANYDVKSTVSIAVDTVRPTDYDAMFDVLVKLYPNITFEFDYWTHSTNDDAREYLSKNMATGTAANIIWDEAGEIPSYIMNGGWIKPITKYVKADPEAKYIPDNLLEDYTYYGEVFAVPHQATFELVVFNTKLQSELGIKDSDMPGLEWTMEEYETLLRKAAAGFSAGKCVAIEDLFEAYNRVSFYNATASGGDYGVRGLNLDTGLYEVKWLQQGCLQFRAWREIAGVEGWFMNQTKSSDGKSTLLNEKLGASGYSTLWEIGKAFMEDTLTVYTEKWDEKYPSLQWKRWPTPNKDGKLMMHVDHCFITSTTPSDRMDACYQALRFMTFSTNGNLARLTMYEDSQQGKYNLTSHVYYPTTTSDTVIKKFNSLSCTDECDEYLVANIKNSCRFDTFKFVAGLRDADGEWDSKMNDVTDGLTDGSELPEYATKVNAKLKEYQTELKTAFDKYYK